MTANLHFHHSEMGSHQSRWLLHETRGEAAAAGCRRGLYIFSQPIYAVQCEGWREVLVAPRPRSLFELRPGSDVNASHLTDPTNESPSSAHQPVSDVRPDELKSARRLKRAAVGEQRCAGVRPTLLNNCY